MRLCPKDLHGLEAPYVPSHSVCVRVHAAFGIASEHFHLWIYSVGKAKGHAVDTTFLQKDL